MHLAGGDDPGKEAKAYLPWHLRQDMSAETQHKYKPYKERVAERRLHQFEKSNEYITNVDKRILILKVSINFRSQGQGYAKPLIPVGALHPLNSVHLADDGHDELF